MINLAVINLKDLLKYLVKIIIIVVILIILVKQIYFPKEEIHIQTTTINLFSKAYTNCLELTIPGIKKQSENSNENIFSFQNILNLEIGMIDNIIKESGLTIDKEELTVDDLDELLEKTDVKTEVVESTVKPKYTNEYGKVQIKNETDFKLTNEMLTPNFELSNKKDILIYHTHTCESYTSSEEFKYKATGNFRTTDLNYTVSRVGDELEKYLKSLEYNVIHDKTFHDFPAYSGSYDRSYETVSKIISENKNIQMVFDLHRDAVGSDGKYGPTVKIDGEEAAQLMFVIGTNGGGLEHPNWLNNLKVAVKIQEVAEEKYPGLFKPIILRNSRYNQNLAPGASIIEVGATGNTMEQCLSSMKYLSVVLNEVLK